MTNHKRKYICFVLSGVTENETETVFLLFVFCPLMCILSLYMWLIQCSDSLYVQSLSHWNVTHLCDSFCSRIIGLELNYTEDVKWWTATDQIIVHWGMGGSREREKSDVCFLGLFCLFLFFLYLLSLCKMNYSSGLKPGLGGKQYLCVKMWKDFPYCLLFLLPLFLACSVLGPLH